MRTMKGLITRNDLMFYIKAGLMMVILLIYTVNLRAQFIITVREGWDGAKIQGSGFVDYGSGKIGSFVERREMIKK